MKFIINQIIKNQVIFLSGGIDSACIALKDKNILDAITILPWGKNSSEKESSKKNAKIADIKSHQFIDVNEKVLKLLMLYCKSNPAIS